MAERVQDVPTLKEQADDALYFDVESSNIKRIGYSEGRFDGVSWLWRNLFVEFKSGSVYCYTDVPQDVHVALMNAVSKGKYLNAYIKGTYSYVKVSD